MLKLKLPYYSRIIWIYTKYQILTKSILFLIGFPLFNFISKILIASTNRTSISSGDYLSFLFSIQGLTLMIILLILLAILVGIDIHAFIIMSALIKEDKAKLNVTTLFVASLKTIKSFFNIEGIMVLLYIAFIIPLVGIGFSVSLTQNFKIPNFITDVIFNNLLYTLLYIAVMIILLIITWLNLFFFHYLIIEKESVKQSLKKSNMLMRKYWRKVIKSFFTKTIIYSVVIIVLILITLTGIFNCLDMISDIFMKRFFIIAMSIILVELIAYVAMMLVPAIFYKLTTLFYELNSLEKNDIRLQININASHLATTKIKLRFKFLVILISCIFLTFTVAISFVLTQFFDEIFKPNYHIDIIAHRGGGDLAAENSLLGIEKAVQNNAKWTEIDVQRTKDGKYIINHDDTFKRVASNISKSIDLTLEEVKKLQIQDLFNENGLSQPIPTLEEVLDYSKNKIGVFIELKGKTADEKMVDDVVKLVKDKNMEKEIAILSLDYKLIDYLENKYPEIDSGYLYFFSLGEISLLKADYLIMEEQEATNEKIKAIHNANKKAIVWTVNTIESIEKFILSQVDGIISDYIVKVNEAIEMRDKRSDIQIILDYIFQ